jgi:hypothetical protein
MVSFHIESVGIIISISEYDGKEQQVQVSKSLSSRIWLTGMASYLNGALTKDIVFSDLQRVQPLSRNVH